MKFHLSSNWMNWKHLENVHCLFLYCYLDGYDEKWAKLEIAVRQNPMSKIQWKTSATYIYIILVCYTWYIYMCVCVFVHNVDPYDKFSIKRRFKHKLRNIRILFNSRHNTLGFKLTILRFIDWTNRFNPHDCRRLNVLNSFLKLLIIVWWCKCGQVYANIHRWIPKSKICFK